jgi:hypothetical protein
VASSTHDQPLAAAADADLLVRAGEMSLDAFRKSTGTCFRNNGFYGLSFFSFPEMSAHEIALEVGEVREETGLRLMPHPTMRHATVRAVRGLGYPLEPDNRPRGHVTLRFEGESTEVDWIALDGVFSAPEANPAAL